MWSRMGVSGLYQYQAITGSASQRTLPLGDDGDGEGSDAVRIIVIFYGTVDMANHQGKRSYFFGVGLSKKYSFSEGKRSRGR